MYFYLLLYYSFWPYQLTLPGSEFNINTILQFYASMSWSICDTRDNKGQILYTIIPRHRLMYLYWSIKYTPMQDRIYYKRKHILILQPNYNKYINIWIIKYTILEFNIIIIIFFNSCRRFILIIFIEYYSDILKYYFTE